MGRTKCIVPSCKDKKSRRVRIPHPVADCYHRYWKWLALIQNPVLFTLDPLDVYNKKRICIRHFSPDRFVIGTKKLKRSALPDKYIGECHKVIRDKDGNVRHDSMCLDLKELSKDHCTLKDIANLSGIGGEIDDLSIGDNFGLVAAFSKGVVAPDGPIAKNFRAWPSGEETSTPSLSERLLSNRDSEQMVMNLHDGASTMEEPIIKQEKITDSSDNPQRIVEDCNSVNNTDEAPDTDNECLTHDDADLREIVSTCDEMNCDKRGTDTLREMLAGDSQETGLIMFIAKAYQIARNFPQELQNRIKKDILDSILRAESQNEQIQSSAKI